MKEIDEKNLEQTAGGYTPAFPTPGKDGLQPVDPNGSCDSFHERSPGLEKRCENCVYCFKDSLSGRFKCVHG